MKLVVLEPETPPLQAELGRWRERVSSSLVLTEVVRACRVYATTGSVPATVDRMVAEAEALMDGVLLLDVDSPLLHAAGVVDPPMMRFLDAIHLATALSIGPELGALITYDQRLASAARAHDIEVLSPN